MLDKEGSLNTFSQFFFVAGIPDWLGILWKADSHMQIKKHEFQLCKYNVLALFDMFTWNTEHLQIWSVKEKKIIQKKLSPWFTYLYKFSNV